MIRAFLFFFLSCALVAANLGIGHSCDHESHSTSKKERAEHSEKSDHESSHHQNCFQCTYRNIQWAQTENSIVPGAILSFSFEEIQTPAMTWTNVELPRRPKPPRT